MKQQRNTGCENKTLHKKNTIVTENPNFESEINAGKISVLKEHI